MMVNRAVAAARPTEISVAGIGTPDFEQASRIGAIMSAPAPSAENLRNCLRSIVPPPEAAVLT